MHGCSYGAPIPNPAGPEFNSRLQHPTGDFDNYASPLKIDTTLNGPLMIATPIPLIINIAAA